MKTTKILLLLALSITQRLTFRKSHLGIAPLLSGAGIKVKVLEMLHTGLDVIGTALACDAIDSIDSLDSNKLFNCELINFKKVLIDYFKL